MQRTDGPDGGLFLAVSVIILPAQGVGIEQAVIVAAEPYTALRVGVYPVEVPEAEPLALKVEGLET